VDFDKACVLVEALRAVSQKGDPVDSIRDVVLGTLECRPMTDQPEECTLCGRRAMFLSDVIKEDPKRLAWLEPHQLMTCPYCREVWIALDTEEEPDA